MLFDAPAALLEGLAAAGVDVATFANNHGLDQGPQGIIATRQALESSGLQSTGAGGDLERAWAPLVIEKNRIKVGFLAFTRRLNGLHNPRDASKPHVALVHYAREPQEGGEDEARLLRRVHEAAAQCDALVVLPHWGEEYEAQPRREDRLLAAKLIEAGALAVVGSHPHVLQPMQSVTRADGTQGWVAFSLGNLVSNQNMLQPESPTREGLLLKLSLQREGPAPVKMVGIELVPLWTQNVLKQGERRNVQPTVIDDELVAMRERLGLLQARVDKPSQQERRVLTRRLQEAQACRERIMRVLPPVVRPGAAQVALDERGTQAVDAPGQPKSDRR